MRRHELATGPGGKDVVVVAAREALAAPSAAELPPPAPAPGLLLPDGSINWGCPCLGGMATGPCGEQFRDAFSCFHYSEAEPKGSDCYEKFSVMQECMSEYPELYGKDDDEELAAAVQAARDQSDQPDQPDQLERSDRPDKLDRPDRPLDPPDRPPGDVPPAGGDTLIHR